MNAVCHRCGGDKAGPLVQCPQCGFEPTGTERATAWLFSSAHLDPEELRLAGRRVRDGELPDPSAALKALAFPHVRPRADARPLARREQVAIAALVVVMTPLAGLAIWWGLREERPIAARQALRISVPVAVVMGALWTALIASRLVN